MPQDAAMAHAKSRQELVLARAANPGCGREGGGGQGPLPSTPSLELPLPLRSVPEPNASQLPKWLRVFSLL